MSVQVPFGKINAEMAIFCWHAVRTVEKKATTRSSSLLFLQMKKLCIGNSAALQTSNKTTGTAKSLSAVKCQFWTTDLIASARINKLTYIKKTRDFLSKMSPGKLIPFFSEGQIYRLNKASCSCS